MPKVSPLQGNFNGGEISPLLHGRVDSDRYKVSLATCKNYIPTIQGGLTRRPGTKFIIEAKSATTQSRLHPFEFSTTQAYVLELSNTVIRVFMNNGIIESSPGTPMEISSPYLTAHLFELKFTQSADVLYITHPSYAPRKLTRLSHTSWVLSTISFLDGPYLPQSTSGITLTPTAATGSVTLSTTPKAITGAANNGAGLIRITAVGHGYSTGDLVGIAGVVGTTEANGSWAITVITANTFDLVGSTFTNAWVSDGTSYIGLFLSTDVGRLIRIKEGSVWGYGTITALVNYGQVTFTVTNTLTNTNAKSVWRLGVYSARTGYPGTTVFHEDRLFFAGTTNYPQRLDGSNSGDYENFAPSDTAGTVAASNAVAFSLNANDVNVIRWMTSDEKGLCIGTVGGEWVVKPSTQNEALSPTNINARRATSLGSANIQAYQIGKASVFVQKSGRKLREFAYFYDVDGFRSADVSQIAEHIMQGGVTQLAIQRDPQSIVWAVRADGTLIGMTYERELDAVKVGWHRHSLGGYGDVNLNPAVVESIAVIPSADGTRDELWVAVKRYLPGVGTKRYIEYLTKIFTEEDAQEDAFFLDCGLTYDSPVTITGITQALNGVVSAASHGFITGDVIAISGVKGMVEANHSWTITRIDANTFRLNTQTTAFGVYTSGGEARKRVTSISGLTHLASQVVDILADGAVVPQATISAGGVLTLENSATVVHIGFAYNSDAQLLRLEAGAADGTALGKTRRTHRVGFLLHRTLGFEFGTDFNDLSRLTFRESDDETDRPVPLYSGIKSETLGADYDFENQICWRQRDPLPGTILAVMPQMVTQDRG